MLGIVGANGAGKSTLVRVLGGEYADYLGQVRIDGRDIRLTRPSDSVEAGIVIVSQQLALCPALSTRENVFLGQELLKCKFPPVLDTKEMRRRTELGLRELGSEIDPDAPVERLGVRDLQLIACVRALISPRRLLILDEPTSNLSAVQVEALQAAVKRRAAQGTAIVLISHRLEEVLAFSDSIAVLRDGQLVFACSSRDATMEQLQQHMFGTTLPTAFREASGEAFPEVILSARQLSTKHFVDLTFDLNAGEVVALVGRAGQHCDEILRALFGAAPICSGSILIKGRHVLLRSPTEAIAAGVAFLSDRRADSLFPNLPLSENIVIPTLHRLSRYGWVQTGEVKRAVAMQIHRFQIRTTGGDQSIEELSGGNQQKALLARWLLSNANILLLDEPFSGIDLKGKSDLIGILTMFRRKKKASLIVCSEPDVLLRACDRLLLLDGQRIIRSVDSSKFSHQELTSHLAGLTR
jgi:ABC-type sugar transport system ATPase subunit